ncbi:MAG: hypothetical protein FRX49_03247 [Trebouxia sp. A1-2]|nr:MAG: hypothetical protein FRX49_03247 [Trebouxia sp. A1-2]
MSAAGEASSKLAAGHSSACLAHRASVPVAALESTAASLVLETDWCEGAGSEGAEIPHQLQKHRQILPLEKGWMVPVGCQPEGPPVPLHGTNSFYRRIRLCNEIIITIGYVTCNTWAPKEECSLTSQDSRPCQLIASTLVVEPREGRAD